MEADQLAVGVSQRQLAVSLARFRRSVIAVGEPALERRQRTFVAELELDPPQAR
jgi:hypothetical protein